MLQSSFTAIEKTVMFIVEPWHWFALGMLLILAELMLPSFAALWFGVAAIIVGLIYSMAPNLNFGLQVLLWIVCSITATVAWFKWIKPLSIDKTQAGLSREATIGQVGMVIDTHLSHEHIQVRFTMPVLGADEWRCRSTQAVEIGERVRVIDILGNDLLVEPYRNLQRD